MTNEIFCCIITLVNVILFCLDTSLEDTELLFEDHEPNQSEAIPEGFSDKDFEGFHNKEARQEKADSYNKAKIFFFCIFPCLAIALIISSKKNSGENTSRTTEQEHKVNKLKIINSETRTSETIFFVKGENNSHNATYEREGNDKTKNQGDFIKRNLISDFNSFGVNTPPKKNNKITWEEVMEQNNIPCDNYTLQIAKSQYPTPENYQEALEGLRTIKATTLEEKMRELNLCDDIKLLEIIEKKENGTPEDYKEKLMELNLSQEDHDILKQIRTSGLFDECVACEKGKTEEYIDLFLLKLILIKKPDKTFEQFKEDFNKLKQIIKEINNDQQSGRKIKFLEETQMLSPGAKKTSSNLEKMISLAKTINDSDYKTFNEYYTVVDQVVTLKSDQAYL